MIRKAIQIITPHPNRAVIIALCNDGTIWKFEPNEWIQLKNIPQPKALFSCVKCSAPFPSQEQLDLHFVKCFSATPE